jgi:glucose-1-phosphate adenylyltransferase
VPTTAATKNDISAALKDTLALVLAGGRGTRLANLTANQAKPAVHIAGKFRIIDFPLSNCINSGVRRIAVLTQYKAHALLHHLQRGWGFLRAEMGEFVEIWPAQQQTSDETWYRGTADAVYQNFQTIVEHRPRYILVLAGDHVYKQDYGAMLAEHMARDADVSVACIEVPREEARAFGVMHIDTESRINNFVEKPDDPPAIPGDPDHALASMGIYVFNAEFLIRRLQREAYAATMSHDFGKDLLPKLVGKCRIFAHRFKNSCVQSKGRGEPYWRDVGTVDAYWAANIDLTSVTPDLDLYDSTWPILTYQVQHPPAKFVFDDDDRRGMAVDSLVSAGCIVSGGAVRRSLLSTGVHVHSFSTVEDSVILPLCNIGRHARLRKVILDERCRVPEGLVAGEDPELDARRFHRTGAGITLITADMIAKL